MSSYAHYLVLAYAPDAPDGDQVYTKHFNRITDAAEQAQKWANEPPRDPSGDTEKIKVAIYQLVEVVKDKPSE